MSCNFPRTYVAFDPIDSGTAVYKGVPLKKVLKKACGGVLPECQHLELIGADTYFKYVDGLGDQCVLG